MDIRVMEYVLAVFEEQSFTRAADKLHIAQPSLSQQIAKLERELGLRLFVRGPGPVRPTVDGMRFVERASGIVRMRGDLWQEMRERSQGMGNALAIGTTAITGGRLLPQLLRSFHAAYPAVHLRLVEEATETLVELAAQGAVDVAVLPLPLDHPGLESTPILTEPLLLAMPPTEQAWMSEGMRAIVHERIDPIGAAAVAEATGRAATDETPGVAGTAPGTTGAESRAAAGSAAPVSLHTFASAPFVMLKQGYGFRRTLLQLCADSGFQPAIAFETGSVDTAQAMVAHGLGVTVVPQMAAHPDATVAPLYLPLNSGPTRTLVFAYPRDRYLSLAARALMDMAR